MRKRKEQEKPQYMGICMREDSAFETLFFLYISSQTGTEMQGILADSFCSSPFIGGVSSSTLRLQRFSPQPIFIKGYLLYLPVRYSGRKQSRAYHGTYFLANEKKGGEFILEPYLASHTLDALCESFLLPSKE